MGGRNIRDTYTGKRMMPEKNGRPLSGETWGAVRDRNHIKSVSLYQPSPLMLLQIEYIFFV